MERRQQCHRLKYWYAQLGRNQLCFVEYDKTAHDIVQLATAAGTCREQKIEELDAGAWALAETNSESGASRPEEAQRIPGCSHDVSANFPEEPRLKACRGSSGLPLAKSSAIDS